MSSWRLVAVAACWVALFVACADGAVLKLGLLYPLSGRESGANRAVGCLMAIGQVNAFNTSIVAPLPGLADVNLTVQYQLMNTAGRPSEATLATLSLLQQWGAHMILGPASSSVCEPTAYISGALQIPQISYACTASSLSNTENFPTFFRVVPPDKSQGHVLVSVAKYFGWNRVAVLHTSGAYGVGLEANFIASAKQLGVNVLISGSYAEGTNSSSDALLQIALENIKASSTRIIVLIASGSDVTACFEAAQQHGLLEPGFVWLGSDGVQNDQFAASPVRSKLQGVLALEPFQGSGTAAFQKFTSYWFQQTVNNFPALQTFADKLGTIASNGTGLTWGQDIFARPANAKTPFSFDSVIVATTAARVVLHRGLPITGPNLLSVMREAAFNASGVSGNVSFDSEGDRTPVYSLINFYDDQANARSVGQWSNGELALSGSVVWSTGASSTPADVPPNIVDEVDSSLKVSLGIMLLCLLILTVVLAVWIRAHTDSPILKATSPTFHYVVILGLVAAYLSAAVLTLGKKEAPVCGTSLLLLLVAFSFVFGALLAKTYRIHQIFLTDLTVSITKKTMSDRQLMIPVLASLAYDIVMWAIWVGVGGYGNRLDGVPDEPFTVFYVCGGDHSELFLTLLLFPKVAGLLVASVLAFRVRSVPYNFNEAKALSLAVYTIILVALFTAPLLLTVTFSPDSLFILNVLSVGAAALGVEIVIFLSKVLQFYGIVDVPQNIESYVSGKSSNRSASQESVEFSTTMSRQEYSRRNAPTEDETI